jgi:D-beta-D-heptose 7-phosphate kinase / D-beta-D-heptose 1-phosphate adenosyltransferase
VTGPLVVVGDTLLDRDLLGNATRLSPDAPVPVVCDLRESPRPGGAGLAALLAAREAQDSGTEVVFVTLLADDEGGQLLRQLLAGHVDVVAGPAADPTPEKVRVRSGGQSLLRMDREERSGAPVRVTGAMLDVVERAGVVLVSDYGRGLAAAPDLRAVVERVAQRRPVVWDPHPTGPRPVRGVRLATPSLAEALHLSGLSGTDGEGGDLALAARAARDLVHRWDASSVAVTLGQTGALLDTGGGNPRLLPAPDVVCMDPCGAGDQFAAAAAVALHRGALPMEAVGMAVSAAARFVATGGAAEVLDWDEPPEPVPVPASAHDVAARVRARNGTVVATGGCFDLLHAGHVATLQEARRLGDCLLVCMNSDRSVRRIKGPNRPIVPQHDRARLLSALGCVDAVEIFDEDTPERLLAELRPDLWVKGGDYGEPTLPESDLVRGWGGQVVILPYLSGRSTTRLVRSAASSFRVDE